MPTEYDRELDACLRIQQAPGLGARSVRKLIDAFGSLHAALWAPTVDLEAAGLSRRAIDAISKSRRMNVDAAYTWASHPRHHLIPFGSAAYPPRLAEISDPPALLYAAGDPELLHHPQLAIVGSRRSTPAGEENAYRFSQHLAAAGIGITSGLALGIDGAAHRGALTAGGITLAVAATGLDRVYPSAHRELAERIVEEGLMISETPLGAPISRGAFPRRNRLISGLSLGVLVVEATTQSGSLVTARLAAEQGREVFAIPGSIHNPMARGCHRLIREGAKLVETADDILSEIAAGGLLTPSAETAPPHANPPSQEGTKDPEHLRLLDVMGYDPTPIDLLVERSGLTPEAISSMLLILELEGAVAKLDGGRYQRLS